MLWETGDAHERVIEFYRSALVDAGWKVNSELSYGRFDAEKEKEKLIISIATGTDQPTSIVARLSR
ncbi:hypothetical protein Enr13x_09360 [Stieleria neptunia]|uniref:Uncharacterized protein n=2 Tax=Stieleria neptunia TaxID=2527979 RepID=A0A518HJS3_9BACT|nr:hypothetical protein Enr13x_09360 [Stieleria neptunia]